MIRIEQNKQLIEDKENIARVAKELGLSENTVRVLFSREINSLEKIKEFLSAEQQPLHNPYLLKNMEAAVKRVRQAIENNEKVLIYGDYDADGICGTAILTRALVGAGLSVFPFIPSRKDDGYGLNQKTLEQLLENIQPDLVITCDCGVSCKNEVEFLLDVGVDVIITDHHELPKQDIPACIIVNPKQEGCEYPSKDICGAVVALKLVQAIFGEGEAKKYLDLAMVATIADMVSVLGESRTIIALGIKKDNLKNKGLLEIIETCGIKGELLPADISFRVAPKINASGRMGDASLALDALLSDDEKEISELSAKLNKINTQRRELSDEVLKDILPLLAEKSFYEKRAVILYKKDWEAGILGIISATVSRRYYRPAFVMSDTIIENEEGTGGNQGSFGRRVISGSSRGINGVSVLELLEGCSDLLLQFGGHSDAAGFMLEEKNLSEFEERIEKQLSKFPQDSFIKTDFYDLTITAADINFEFAKELKRLEPFGKGFRRPLFLFQTDKKMSTTPAKSNFKHLHLSVDNIKMIAFSFLEKEQFVLADGKKNILLELSVDEFNNKVYPNPIVKNITSESIYYNERVARANYLRTLFVKESPEKAKFFTYETLENEIPRFGTVFICANKASFSNFIKTVKTPIYNEFMYFSDENNFSRVIISPSFSSILPSLSLYNKIIFLDSVLDENLIKLINKRTSALVFVPKIDNRRELLKTVSLERESFTKSFSIIKNNPEIEGFHYFDYVEKVLKEDPRVEMENFVLALGVFTELKIIQHNLKNGFSVSISKERGNLDQSTIYKRVRDILC